MLCAGHASTPCADKGFQRPQVCRVSSVFLVVVGTKSALWSSAHPKGNVTEAGPIRVYARDGRWLVNYGSSIRGAYDTRAEAVAVAMAAAFVERRELTIGPEPLALRGFYARV